MRIGIDIDGVLTDIDKFTIDYFSKYCVENGIDYNIGKADYYVSKTFGIDHKIEEDFWDKYLIYYSLNEKPRKFASEIIRKLKSDGNEIYIITARWTANRDDEIGKNMRNIVINWLSENDIYYDELIFSKAAKERKSQEIVDNNIDIMIEDNPNNILELSKIIPIICYDT